MGSGGGRGGEALQGGSFARGAPCTATEPTRCSRGSIAVSRVHERLRVRASELGPREALIAVEVIAPGAGADGWQHGAGLSRPRRQPYS